MKKLNLLLLGFSFALLSGCATASFTKTGETFPKYEGPVRVFAENPKNVVYVEIGIVSAKGGPVHNDANLVKALLRKAAKHGANAIVLITYRQTRRVDVYGGAYGFYGNSGTPKDMRAIAIRIIKEN